MKISSILLLAAGASAQFSIYTQVANSINAQVTSLNSLVVAYTGGNGAPIISQASKVLTVVSSGVTRINAASPITVFADAISLLTYYTPLASNIKTVVSNLDGKHNLAVANGLCSSARTILSQELTAANSLATAVTNKLQGSATPARPVAQTQVVIPITSALSSGISVYNTC